MTKVIAIVAIGNQGQIGLKGNLPWKCKEDLKLFRSVTMDKLCMVGYNTKATLPPLEGRDITLGSVDIDPGVWISHVLEHSGRDELVIIGGAKTYARYAHTVDEWHVSHIDYNGEADAYYELPETLKEGAVVHHYNFTPEPDYSDFSQVRKLLDAAKIELAKQEKLVDTHKHKVNSMADNITFRLKLTQCEYWAKRVKLLNELIRQDPAPFFNQVK